MFLILIVVYLFHGLQTLHAAPLATDIFTNTSAASSTSGCVCPVDQRSIWDILWSSLATIFACSWVSVHPNIPGPDEAWWRILLRRLELMFWAVVGPELLIAWAFRQWLGARKLERLYKDRGWTRTHGHFIQMGGFMLFEGQDAKGVLSPEQLPKLLEAKKIEFPTITVEEMNDRSKGDSFSKTIAVGQTLWFIVQCLARRAEHLDITLVELLTLSLAVLNGLMYFLWWHKPLDVRCPVRVYLLDKLDQPNEAVDSDSENLDRMAYSIWNSTVLKCYAVMSLAETLLEEILSLRQSPLPILSKFLKLIIIILLFSALSPILLLLVFSLLSLFPILRWASLITANRIRNAGDMKVPTFYSSKHSDGDEISVSVLSLLSVAGVVFGGIHCAGWFFIFPSSEEAILWRVCSVVLTGTAFLLPLLVFFGAQLTEGSFGDLLRIPVMIGIVYVLSRLFLLVEAFISLRHLTSGMLALVKWTSFIPHI